ncbi:hypothetical protein ACI65C_011288 [Semiaphis heraclei]
MSGIYGCSSPQLFLNGWDLQLYGCSIFPNLKHVLSFKANENRPHLKHEQFEHQHFHKYVCRVYNPNPYCSCRRRAWAHGDIYASWPTLCSLLRFGILLMLELFINVVVLKRLQNDLANNYNQDIERLKLEQESLKAQVETEIAKLKKQKIQTGNDINKCITSFIDDKEGALAVKKIENEKCSENIDVKKNNQTLKTEKKQKKNNPAVPAKNTITTPVDFGRLDLRVAKILSASKHPNADALYVETIDVGEEKPRNVVSGLVKFVSLEAMSNRMVVLLCNLKPSKIRGVLSEAMVMCASSPENVEILEPPPGSVPGDYINVDGYTRSPDKVLKVFEEIAQDLKTDENLQATYKGIPWTVADKGAVVTKSLKNVKIK